MNRLHESDINTPEHFDAIWKQEHLHRYDTERIEAFLRLAKPTDRICDVGAGWFGIAQFAGTRTNRSVAVDFSLEALRRTRIDSRLAVHCVSADARHLPFRDATFDCVFAGELIEHIESPRSLALEMWRICKRGGTMAISTVDTHCPEAIAHGDYPEHLWEFETEELDHLFADFGTRSYRLVGTYHFLECHKQ